MLYEYGDGYIASKFYWYIDYDGTIHRKLYNFEWIDDHRYYNHNTFATEEAAIKQRDRLIAEGKITKTIREIKMIEVEKLKNKIEQKEKEVHNMIDELEEYKNKLSTI